MQRILIFLLTLPLTSFSQESKKLTLRGYIKEMHTFTYIESNNLLLNDNLIHNRLNLRWYPSKNITTALEVRNRIFRGDQVRSTSNFLETVNPYSSYLDLGHGEKILGGGAAWYSNIDRLWAKYMAKKWEVTVGRQRINWGINTAWNSNDLFNTYNFVDFDYEERPGSDAIRLQYYPGLLSSAEVAVKPGESPDDWVAAALYGFNKWTYDFQFISGLYYTDIAIGAGWAGNIKGAGFKGEATYFHPREHSFDTSGVLSLSSGIDYLFGNNLYLNISFLLNTGGIADLPSSGGLSGPSVFSGAITAKNLMPSVTTVFLQISKPINPILNTSLAILYSPGVNAFFAMPSLTYSIKENWDIDLLAQTLFLEITGDFSHFSTSGFLRLKYSF